MRDLNVAIQPSFLPYLAEEKIITVFDEMHPFPATRYQGSKNKLTDWIWENIYDINFTTVLDAFGGTGSVSHMLKRKGKEVIYNDILRFNSIIGTALIENDSILLTEEDIEFILNNDSGSFNFIQKTFKGIFYTDEENAWLDKTIFNIELLGDRYKRAIAYFSLFQSCIIKRPYNLFHRANLYLRLSTVKRSFGNKATWDKSFESCFRHFAAEANSSIFSNGKNCVALNKDVVTFDSKNIDLVYLDPPYISSNGVGTDYLDFYHFLEGIANYKTWNNKINHRYKHLPIKNKKKNPWTNKNQIEREFHKIISKFSDSTIVISYRSDGIPSIEQICDILSQYGKEMCVVSNRDYKYALSHSKTKEVLIISK